jgi:hypothetical protein
MSEGLKVTCRAEISGGAGMVDVVVQPPALLPPQGALTIKSATVAILRSSTGRRSRGSSNRTDLILFHQKIEAPPRPQQALGPSAPAPRSSTSCAGSRPSSG